MPACRRRPCKAFCELLGVPSFRSSVLVALRLLRLVKGFKSEGAPKVTSILRAIRKGRVQVVTRPLKLQELVWIALELTLGGSCKRATMGD